MHDEVSEHYRRRVRQLIEANACGPACFPPPPVPGIPGRIEPVTSASDLVDEGEMQGNCVASYAGRVREGNLYIYRVLKPERATLSITRSGPFAEWEIGELECRFNTDVSEETEELVQAGSTGMACSPEPARKLCKVRGEGSSNSRTRVG